MEAICQPVYLAWGDGRESLRQNSVVMSRQTLIVHGNCVAPRERPRSQGICQALVFRYGLAESDREEGSSSKAMSKSGQTTVASLNTSANRPPSSGGTNFPHETPS